MVQKDFTKVEQEKLDKFRFAVNKDFYPIQKNRANQVPACAIQ